MKHNLRVNLDDDWLNVPGYIPETLLSAIKAHESAQRPKLQFPTQGMLERLVALSCG